MAEEPVYQNPTPPQESRGGRIWSWCVRLVEATQLVAPRKVGDEVVHEKVHLVVPEFGGGAGGGDGARRPERGASVAIPLVLGVRSGRQEAVRRGVAGGSPGCLHAGSRRTCPT